MTIIAFVPDLMDRSRFGPVAGEKVFVTTPDALSQAGAGDVVVADLGRPGAMAALAALNGPRRVAFASHVDTELIAQAKAAGLEVLPRSRFFSHIVEILGQDER